MQHNSQTIMRRVALVPALLLILVVAVACGGTTAVEESATADANVTGTVTYLQRSLLIPGSVVTVQIQDVSRMDAPAEIIGEQVIVTTNEQVPIAYSVPYSTAAIVDNHTYSMRATIENPDGRLQFTSDTMIPVITNGAPTSDVEIMVVGVGSPAAAAPDASVTGTVTYMQRMAMAPGSTITVQIQDVSRMDVAAEIVGEQVIVITDQQVPIAYEVPYSSADIVDRNRYVVRATIDDPDGNLIFTSDTAIPVITNGAPTSDVEIVVVPVSGASRQPDASVTGTVTYLQRIALPGDAIVTVRIEDVSLADAPSTVIGEQVFRTAGAQVPLPYEVMYNTADIIDNHSYTVSARITDAAGRLLFINDTAIPVITNGAPTADVEIMTIPVGAASVVPDAAVTGTVTYLQRIALVPGSTITVQIQDVSRMDVAAEIIGEQVIVTTDEQVPVAFEVPYSTADIVDVNTYAIQARIENPEGQLIFINDTFTPVITRDAPTSDVEVMVVPVGGASAPTTDAAVTGTVTYLERVALAFDAIITVQILDVSLADAPAVVVGETWFNADGNQVPFAYEVGYNTADIIDSNSYVVRATITDPAGTLLFTSDTAIPVITRDAPTSDVEIVVVPVG